LTGKRHDTSTELYANKTLAHRHKLAISMFLIHHVKSFFVPKKTQKKQLIWELLMREAKS
jgi:hypothetical protein